MIKVFKCLYITCSTDASDVTFIMIFLWNGFYIENEVRRMEMNKIAKSIMEIIERDPERLIAMEFLRIHMDAIQNWLSDVDEEKILNLVLAAIKFYKEYLKNALWNSHAGNSLRDYLRHTLLLPLKLGMLEDTDDEDSSHMFR